MWSQEHASNEKTTQRHRKPIGVRWLLAACVWVPNGCQTLHHFVAGASCRCCCMQRCNEQQKNLKVTQATAWRFLGQQDKTSKLL